MQIYIQIYQFPFLLGHLVYEQRALLYRCLYAAIICFVLCMYYVCNIYGRTPRELKLQNYYHPALGRERGNSGK